MKENAVVKRFYRRFISLKGNPEQVAIGLSIGVFVGITPIIPFHTLLAFALALALKQNCTASVVGATVIANPITIPFFYITEYHLGKYLLGRNMKEVVFSDYHMWDILHVGWTVAYPLLVGGIALAFILALPAYVIARKIVIILRRKKSYVNPPENT
ncbi:MAG: DUF2062 domain-containing protein [Thermodesulfobacteriota bacterium]|nr:DUF2062 domain-containing protein [Thermodesulfobacteriota bacterium]